MTWPNNGTARTLKDENKENKNAIHGALTMNPSSVMPCDNKVSTSKIINSAYCLGNTDGQNSVEQNDPGICAGGTACIDKNLQDYIHEDPIPLDTKPVRQLTKMNSNENVERWLKYYQAPHHDKERHRLSKKVLRTRREMLQKSTLLNSSTSSPEPPLRSSHNHTGKIAHHSVRSSSEMDGLFSSDGHFTEFDPKHAHLSAKHNFSKQTFLKNVPNALETFSGMNSGISGAVGNRSTETSLTRLNASLLQFIAEMIEGLENAKQNESEWSTAVLEKCSAPQPSSEAMGIINGEGAGNSDVVLQSQNSSNLCKSSNLQERLANEVVFGNDCKKASGHCRNPSMSSSMNNSDKDVVR